MISDMQDHSEGFFPARLTPLKRGGEPRSYHEPDRLVSIVWYFWMICQIGVLGHKLSWWALPFIQ